MRVAIISDTHIPSRATKIPDWVVEEVEAADYVIHAGDFDSPEAYERVQELAPTLTAVIGNLDPASIDLPEVDTLFVEGVQFVVTHGSGDIEGYADRVGETVAEYADDSDESSAESTVGVSGHTHQVMDEQLGDHRVLNPGSATGADPAPYASMMVAEVTDGELRVTVHEE